MNIKVDTCQGGQVVLWAYVGWMNFGLLSVGWMNVLEPLSLPPIQESGHQILPCSHSYPPSPCPALTLPLTSQPGLLPLNQILPCSPTLYHVNRLYSDSKEASALSHTRPPIEYNT